MALTQPVGASLELAKKDAEELVARWEAAINNRGSTAAAAQKVANLFTPDAVINIAGNVQIGRAAIEKFYAEQIEENDPRDFHSTIVEVKASGNIAWAYGFATEKLRDKPNDLFWGAVYEFSDGRYRVKMLTAGFKLQCHPPAAAFKELAG